MMNGFILQENTSILISRNGKTLYSILHRSLDLTINNLHSSISKSYFKQDSINLRTVCVKDVVDAETGKITEHF